MLFFYACSDEEDVIDDIDEPEEPAGVEEMRITDVSGTTLEYTHDLEIGTNPEEDIVFSKTSEIMRAGVGHVYEKTLDCYGLAATAYEGTEVDSVRLKQIKNVTIINRGTMTVHTKDLVERYKDLVDTPEDSSRPYYYLRVLCLYAAENCTVINKGVINVYFDHDPLNTSTIYTIALTGESGSTIINEGEIHFYGNGSINTRLRGVATQGDYVTVINRGIITSEVEMADDQRGITTGGDYNNIVNDATGVMRFRGPGEICGLSSGINNVVNNGTIDITHVDMPDTYCKVEQSTGVIGGIFLNVIGASTLQPVVNRGTITMKAITTANTPSASNVHGIYIVNVTGAVVDLVNEGNITATQEGPTRINMAEAYFNSGGRLMNPQFGSWVTTLRDFTEQPLFMGVNANLNFAEGSLQLKKGEGYVDGTAYSVAPDVLFSHDSASASVGYEELSITSFDCANDTLNWDKEAQTAALQ